MAKSDATITATVELQTDESGLKATLTMVKDPAGQTWTAAGIITLIKQKNIAATMDADAIRRKVEQMASAREERVVMTVAEGLAPGPAEPERARFGDFAVPAELADQIKRVVAAAANPEIIHHRSRKIQKQQIRRKKAALPFLKPREERVMVTETEQIPERVYVDPTVEQTGWVTEGTSIGKVSPQKTGTPGRNVFGAIIHPKPVSDPHFYCGQGLRRQGEDITATASGILRVGANWADVVPFRPHSGGVELSEDKVSAYYVFEPGAPDADLPSTAEILAAAVERGFAQEQLISEAELSGALRDATSHGRPERIALTASRDSSYDVVVSEDRLKAVLNLSKGKGRGTPLVLKDVGYAIRSAGLARLDQKRIQEEIVAFYRSTETDLIGYILVEGTPAGEGPDREPEFSIRPVPVTQQRDMVRRLTEDPRTHEGIGSLDAFPAGEVTVMALVDSEQRIVTIPPETAGTPGTDVYGKAIPGTSRPEPQFRLFENLTKAGNVIISQIDGVVDRAEKEGVFYLRVRPHSDAVITVTVTQDKTKAFLSLADGAGTGRRLDESTVMDAISKANVRHGLNEANLKAAIRAAMDGERITNLLIAEATMPDRPSDRTFELLIKPITNRDVRIRDDGSADYKNPDNIRTVAAGARLARIIPRPTEARPGTDVTGAPIQPSTTVRPDPEPGAFVRREEQQDGTVLLIAEREGEFVFEANRLEIRVEHGIAGNVGLASGNIKFPGTVTISGTVTSGFFVVAGGDITVGEAVEASLLSADGNILVRQGIKGGGKGVLRAKGAIGTGFAEQSVLLSVGDITINAGALHCTIKTNGKVVVQKDKGGIVGGTVRARDGVSAPNLGSANGVKTAISFGQDYLIADQIEKEEKEIDQIKRRVTAADLSMRKEGISPERVEALRQEKKRLLKVMEKRGLRLFTLRERFEQHHDSSVTVRGTIHPGVTLESHGRTLDVSSPRKAVSFIFDQRTGHIVEQPLKE